MYIFEREIVDKKSGDKRKADTQVERHEVQEYQVVVKGKDLGLKNNNDYVLGGLAAVDWRMKDFWQSLGKTDDERAKNWKGDAVPMLRWLSAVGDPDWNAWNRNGKKGRPPLKDNDVTAYYLMFTNEVVNIGYWDLMDHPQLQFLLMTIIGLGEKQNHAWLGMPKKKKLGTSKLDDLFYKLYPSANDIELNILKSSNTKEDIKNLCLDLGMEDKEIKEILAEFKKFNDEK